jgi:hypothetical protein
MCLTNYSFDAIHHSTLEGGIGWPNPDESTFLLRNLLKNAGFRQQYLDRFEQHLRTTFNEENMEAALSPLENMIDPLMEEQIARWNYPAYYSDWRYNIGVIRVFFENRPCYMLHHLISHFEIVDNTYGTGVCDTINYYDSFTRNNTIAIWPNPAKESISVELLYTENVESIVSIEIVDLLGRNVQEVTIPNDPYISLFYVNLEDLRPGTYVLVIKCLGYIANKRFVIL